MSNDRTTQAEPAEDSLAEMPEVDFSRAIRPNKLAGLGGDFKQAVFLDKDLWQHFGSEASACSRRCACWCRWPNAARGRLPRGRSL